MRCGPTGVGPIASEFARGRIKPSRVDNAHTVEHLPPMSAFTKSQIDAMGDRLRQGSVVADDDLRLLDD